MYIFMFDTIQELFFLMENQNQEKCYKCAKICHNNVQICQNLRKLKKIAKIYHFILNLPQISGGIAPHQLWTPQQEKRFGSAVQSFKLGERSRVWSCPAGILKIEISLRIILHKSFHQDMEWGQFSKELERGWHR